MEMAVAYLDKRERELSTVVHLTVVPRRERVLADLQLVIQSTCAFAEQEADEPLVRRNQLCATRIILHSAFFSFYVLFSIYLVELFVSLHQSAGMLARPTSEYRPCR